MLRTLGIVAALQFLTLTSTWACTGQVGAVIFQDKFTDDSGGWDEYPPQSAVVPPAFVFTLDANNSSAASQNLTFNATDGDYCMDFILPPAIAADNQMYIAMEFWAVDYNNNMQVLVASNSIVTLGKLTSGTWTTISSIPNVSAFNSKANAVNSLRVTALAGTITAYLNGTMIKTVRAQQPTTPNLRFGIYVQDDTAVANTPPIKITGFSVTAGK
jgi:hypothetical protein